MAGKIIFISVLIALFDLDNFSLAQIKISRPIICGPIVGFVTGDLFTGISIGILFELFLLHLLPLGAAITISPPFITMITISLMRFISPGGFNPAVSVFLIAVVFPIALIFSSIEVFQKKVINKRITYFLDKTVEKGLFNNIEKATYFGVVLNFLRTFIFSLLTIFLGIKILPKLFIQLSFLHRFFEKTYPFLFAIGIAVSFNTFLFKIKKGVK